MERRSLLRPFAFAVLVVAVIWAAVILRWRAVNRVPGTLDVALYLLALPVGLLLAFWAIRKSVEAVKRKRAAKVASAGSTDPGSTAATDTENPTLAWWLPIVAADMSLPAGDSADAILEAAAARQRVDLHPHLKDPHGMPAFAAMVGAVDAEAVRDALPESLQAWSDARLRTLALADLLATRVLDSHFDALVPSPVPGAARAREQPPVLVLEYWLPPAWSDTDREAARQWLCDRLAAQGWNAPSVTAEVRAPAAGVPALLRLDELIRAWNQGALELPRLVLAADSGVDANTIAEWDAARRLFSSRNPNGQVPGEGASAVLIGAMGRTQPPDIAHLHRVFSGPRARAVDAPQRVQSNALAGLIEKTGIAAERADAEWALIGDTDVRSSRTAEALHLAGEVQPERDPVAALLPLAMANGDGGAALTLGLVAAAARHCATQDQAALVFSQCDPTHRAVVKLTPPPPALPDAGDPPDTAAT